jgi:hypothetical protein
MDMDRPAAREHPMVVVQIGNEKVQVALYGF